jgi:hypothetical protein
MEGFPKILRAYPNSFTIFSLDLNEFLVKKIVQSSITSPPKVETS